MPEIGQRVIIKTTCGDFVSEYDGRFIATRSGNKKQYFKDSIILEWMPL